MDGEQSLDSFFGKSAPAPTPAPPVQNLAPQDTAQAPYVNASNLAAESLSTYAQRMNQAGFQPTSDQSGTIASKALQDANANNLELQRGQFNRQEDMKTAEQRKTFDTNLELQKDQANRSAETQAQAVRANQSYAINQGLGAVKTRPPEGDIERANHIDEAFKAMDNMQDSWQRASKDWNFGNPITGHLQAPEFSPNQALFNQSQKLAATSIANGILPYTSGADAKAAVQHQMEIDSPSSVDTAQIASGKMVGLLQKGMNGALALRKSLADNNFDTTHIDDVIKTNAPILAKANYWYSQNNPQANQVVPGNNGSTFSAEAQARMNQLSGSPNAGTVSNASPSPGNPPAAQPTPVTPPSWPNK